MSDDHEMIANLGQAQEALVGHRIIKVIYYSLPTDTAEAWDFDTWHCPVMGVEFVLDDGSRSSAVWDSSFGHFHLHLSASPMSEHLGPDGRRWAVHDHPRWKRLLTAPVIGSRLTWQQDLTDTGQNAPAALRLTFLAGTVWIIAAMLQNDDSWWIGADEVVVAFTEEVAVKTGVRKPTW